MSQSQTAPSFSSKQEVLDYVTPLCANPADWEQAACIISAHMQHLNDLPEMHYILGRVAYDKNDLQNAAQHFHQQLQLDNQSIDACYHLGHTLLDMGDLQQAMRFLNLAIKLKPDHLDALCALGRCMQNMQRPELALQCFESVATHDANYPLIHALLANVKDAMGQGDEASALYEKAMQQDPTNVSVLSNMASRTKHALDSDFANHLHQHYKTLNHDTPSRDLCNMNFALATLYDKNKDLSTAYDYYAKANLIQSQLTPCAIEKMEAAGNALIQNFSAQYIDSLPKELGCPDAAPIFIIGMPRSGSTLTEQILASHPDVQGAGELDIIRHIRMSEIPKLTNAKYPNNIHLLSADKFAALGEYYMTHLRSFSNSTHVVDKALPNYYHVALIKLMLPNAKIIHCMREPMDTCWSLWRQNFADRFNYKCTFETLARSYGLYKRLMAHWHTVLPNAVYDIRYEQLVDDPETQIRALLEHCNLPWHDDCLNFHQTKRTVATASLHQVNQPMYKSAIKSWQAVETQLKPLQEVLEKHGAYA